MKTFAIALRQVGRNRRRTTVTIAAMAFAGIMMVFYVSLMRGFIVSMEENVLAMDTGDAQIHAEGYLDDPNLYKRIEGVDKVLADLDAAGYKAAPRLHGQALAAAGTTSGGAMLRGIDLTREPQVTKLNQNIKEGQWLDAADPLGIVIGRKLARTLDTGIGGEVIVLGQDAQGGMANELFKVRGILGAVSEAVDRGGLFMVEPTFRELMVIETGTHQILVVRPDRSIPVAMDVDKIKAALDGKHDVQSWRELKPIMATMIESSDAGMFIMIFITYAAVAMVIFNAMLMNVFERIREFGVMKAIGVPPRQVWSIIMLEAIIQSVIASLLAIAIGVPVSLYFQTNGIDLTEFVGSVSAGGMMIEPVWRTHVTTESVTTPIAFLFVISVLSVIYPAFKAALIKPVEALRHR